MRCLLQFTTIIFLASACKIKAERDEIIAAPIDSTTLYFPFRESPIKDYVDTKMFDSISSIWYSKELFDLSEPVLYSYSGDYEIYRFTWLRSFNNPVSFRLQKKQKRIVLITKISDGVGDRKGKIVLNKSKNVSEREWARFKSLFQSINFWKLPTELYNSGADGADWILEGYFDKNYHWVSRWSPRDEIYSDYRKVCEYLMSLSEIHFDSEEIY